jgi:hypothetical protein
MSEDDLVETGFRPDESLVKVTKRLICSRCHSKAVSAYRFVDEELSPVFPGKLKPGLSTGLQAPGNSRDKGVFEPCLISPNPSSLQRPQDDGYSTYCACR